MSIVKKWEREEYVFGGFGVMSSTAFEVMVMSTSIIGASLASAFMILYFSCDSVTSCAVAGECDRIFLDSTRYLPQCNMRRVPPMMSDLDYLFVPLDPLDPLDSSRSNNSSHSSSSYIPSPSVASALRAYCPPGERLQTWHGMTGTQDGHAQSACVPQYTYPNSLNPEIQDPDASTYTRRQCGKWMDAGVVHDVNAETAMYWHEAGMVQETDAVFEASLASVTSSLSRTQVGKMAEKCEQTLMAGTAATMTSTRDAYAYLVSASKIEETSSSSSILESLGVVLGHYCDGPVSIGWDYGVLQSTGENAFVRTMSTGTRFSDAGIAEALAYMGEPPDAIDLAVQANRRLNDAADAASAPPTRSVLNSVYAGASGRAVPVDMPLVQEHADELVAFASLLEESQGEEGSVLARAYVKALAAVCSSAVGQMTRHAGRPSSHPSSSSSFASLSNDLDPTRRGLPSVSALGRLAHAEDPISMLTNATMRAATTATLSQIRIDRHQHPGILVSTTEDVVCASFVSAVFPDAMDAERFSIVFSARLYERLRNTIPRIQGGVSDALRVDPVLQGVLRDAHAVADDVDRVRIRIPGAPRGTWAGANRPLPYASFTSDESFFVMILKQARAVFLDRQASLVFDETDMCEGPSVFDSLALNAYIIPSYHCSYHMLGMSMRPFADEAFDEESMLSRIGYVVAHELGHCTVNSAWNSTNLQSLLWRYHPDTYAEALADVVGGIGLLQSNKKSSFQLDASRLCAHVCQTWCARTGSEYASVQRGKHPLANERGDRFCATLLDDLKR